MTAKKQSLLSKENVANIKKNIFSPLYKGLQTKKNLEVFKRTCSLFLSFLKYLRLQGVLLENHPDPSALLAPENICQVTPRSKLNFPPFVRMYNVNILYTSTLQSNPLSVRCIDVFSVKYSMFDSVFSQSIPGANILLISHNPNCYA